MPGISWPLILIPLLNLAVPIAIVVLMWKYNEKLRLSKNILAFVSVILLAYAVYFGLVMLASNILTS